jgi:DNA-binding response OmpR family regulator
MLNVLLIEDEPRVADFILRGLRAEGWTVAHVGDGDRGLALARESDFDVIVLDLMLPGLPGMDVCRKLRARRVHTPILMLTALDELDDRLEGLRVGADDYLVKPFEFDELVARIAALHRRAVDFAAEAACRRLEVGPLALDLATFDVTVAGRPIDVTAKERELLKLLMSSPGRVFSRERILSSIWSASEDPLTNIVDVYIARLRKKCGEAAPLLETVRGAGYRIRAPGERSPD